MGSRGYAKNSTGSLAKFTRGTTRQLPVDISESKGCKKCFLDIAGVVLSSPEELQTIELGRKALAQQADLEEFRNYIESRRYCEYRFGPRGWSGCNVRELECGIYDFLGLRTDVLSASLRIREFVARHELQHELQFFSIPVGMDLSWRMEFRLELDANASAWRYRLRTASTWLDRVRRPLIPFHNLASAFFSACGPRQLFLACITIAIIVVVVLQFVNISSGTLLISILILAGLEVFMRS